MQYGWTAPPGETVVLPGDNTVWTATGGPLTTGNTVTLSWDNGARPDVPDRVLGRRQLHVHRRQSVRNAPASRWQLLPWSRVRRDYKPVTSGYYILHEGLFGFFDGSLKEITYDKAKTEGDKKGGIAEEATATVAAGPVSPTNTGWPR